MILRMWYLSLNVCFQDFLLLDELEDSTVIRNSSTGPKDCRVTALDMSGTWDKVNLVDSVVTM